MVPWESGLEYDFLCLLEVDRAVTAFCAQPCRLTYEIDGRQHSHIPDFWVERLGQECFCEVKPSSKAEAPPVQVRTEVLTEQLARSGICYEVVTEREIRVQPRLTNAQILLRGRGCLPTLKRQQAIQSFLVCSSSTLGGIVQALASHGVRQDHLLAMALTNMLVIDQSRPIDNSAWVRLP